MQVYFNKAVNDISLLHTHMLQASDLQKRVAAIAILAFCCLACLAVCCLIFRCCCCTWIKSDDSDSDEDTIEKYKNALEKDPHNPAAKQDYAQALYNLKRYEAAAEQFEEMLKTKPKDIHLINKYGHCLLEQGLLREAADQFEKALTIGPSNFDALEKSADILYLQGKYPEAKKAYEKMKHDISKFEDSSGYGKTLIALGDYRHAIDHFNSDKLVHEISDALAELVKNGHKVEAIEFCDLLLKDIDQNLVIQTYNSREYNEKMTIALQQVAFFAEKLRTLNHLSESQDIFDKILTSWWRGHPYGRNSDHKEIKASQKILTDFGSIIAFANEHLGALFAQSNDPRAEECFSDALKLHDSDFAKNHYGAYLARQGNLTKAKLFLTGVVVPGINLDNYGRNHLGFVYSAEGELERALEEFEKVLSTEPNNVFALSHAAEVLYKQDKFAEADQMIKKALEEEPKNALALKLQPLVEKELQNLEESDS